MTPTWLSATQQDIDITLADFFAQRYAHPKDASENNFFDAMRYAVEGGGKRLRMTLAILAYEHIAKHEIPKNIKISLLAIEMIHAYTLVHDDLPCMDNDILRRGKPTVWKKYGETLAVLVGDGLQTLAFELMAKGGDARAVLEFAHALGDLGVVRGQVRDTLLQQNTLTLDELLRIHDEKTGGFIASSLVIGGILAHGDEQILGVLRRFGMLLGRAFQVRDDILDYEGDPAVTGKMTGKDVHLGKGIVALVGIDETKQILQKLQQDINACLQIIGDDRLAEIANYIITREK